MFANKSTVDGRPICPMQGCHRPINPGEGQGVGISEATAERFWMLDVLESPQTLVIVHITCAPAPHLAKEHAA